MPSQDDTFIRNTKIGPKYSKTRLSKRFDKYIGKLMMGGYMSNLK